MPVAVLAALMLAGLAGAAPQVIINEIHYHPVERPAFSNGVPVLDLTHDVHEFVELYNFGLTNVPLTGWRLGGDVEFDFPSNAVLHAGQYLVVARDPARLDAIVQYTNLTATNLVGPYTGNLGNNNGSVRLRDPLDNIVDSVSFSAQFPWAISADALGADDEWTGLRETNFQYRGRSLERVSPTWAANDPANWLASPTNGPSPGRSNAVGRTIPKPVVVSQSASVAATGARIIRSNDVVRIDAAFSGTNLLSSVSVQYFADDINSTTETVTITSMSVTGAPAAGRYTALLPVRPDRTVLRYRIRANRGTGIEIVSPRADDPFLWHAYYVSPVRTSTDRIYDCFISTASLNTLATNLNPANPAGVDTAVLRRITNPNPPGAPSVTWNATEPAILVYDGEVYDARARYHGSQYRRAPGNNSWKWQFPRYKPLDGRQGIFISDNDDITMVCGALYRLAGVPQSYTKWIDFYLNSSAVVRRMDQDEMDDGLVNKFFDELRLANPAMPQESSGEFYKSQGNFLFTDPTGPFGYGGFRRLAARPPYWTELQRYEHTFGLQMNGWKGHTQFMDMIVGMWTARGDSPSAVSPNIPALRAWLGANFDIDTTLTSMAIRVWTGGWDNFNHNHFVWRRENGKWVTLQWDFDGELSLGDTSSSIYLSEFGAPLIFTTFGQTINGVPWVDANWLNDSFFKAYREEYKRKLFILNNTLLNPTNISALGFERYRTFANGRFASVNSQLGLGAFRRPNRPTNLTPLAGQIALPPVSFTASAYSHPLNVPHASTTWSIRPASGSYTAAVYKTTSTSNLTSLPIPFASLAFGQTYFWKCVYTDTNGHPSFESLETSFAFGGTVTTPGAIVLNEIMADNRAAVANGNTSPDYIELLNTTGADQSLNGLSLSDDVLLPGKYVFPPGAMIPAFSRLVVWCDDETNAPGLHTGFGLDNDGQTLALFAVGPGTYQLADVATFGIQAPNYSLSRDPDGFGAWQLALPTPAMGNDFTSTPTASPANLKINEWMATDANGPDWFELYNPGNLPVVLGGLYFSDNPFYATNSPVPPLSFIGPRSYVQFIADNRPEDNARHVGFRLDGSGDALALYNGATVVDSLYFGPQFSGVSEGRLPDGATNIVSFPNSASPNDPNYLPLNTLVINEVLAHSDPPFEDAVEILNLTGTNISVGGWWLTDDKNDPDKFQLPPEAVVPANGYLVIYENQFNPAPGVPPSFAFSSARGDAVHLSVSDAGGALTGYRVSANFDPSETGVSHGRFPTSQGVKFVALGARTFGADNATTVEDFRLGAGAANAYAKVGPVVISEVMFHPPDFAGGTNNSRDEYIELRNLSGVSTPLFDLTNSWRLRDAVDYTFPANTTLLPGETVLVVGFDPATNAPALAGFLDTYGAVSQRLFGPWSGELNNSSDSVELVKPDAPVAEPGPDLGYVPSILLDRVKYEDSFPWPAGADGAGYSLMRSVASAYGNDPTNWFAWFPTAGATNFYNLPPVVTLTGPADGTNVLAPATILLSATASDPDGTVTKVEFFDGAIKLGEDLSVPYEFLWSNPPLGPHSVTARARDNGNASALTAPISINIITVPPTVTLTSPAAAAVFQPGVNVSLAATATDPDSPVSRMEFYVDGAKLSEDPNAPYTGTWMTATPGYRFLSAVATDSSGTRGTSAVSRVFVQAVSNVNLTLVASNSAWRYLDNGTDQGTAWRALNFADGAWGSGPAELGFGDAAEGRPEATLISRTNPAGANIITYYFRQKFVLNSVADLTNAILSVVRDDGAVAYLNGTEVFRDNIPLGTVNFLTLAPLAIAGAGESALIPTNVSPALLVAGTNILAIEVHQQTNTSSDVSFAAELRVSRRSLGPAITVHPQNVTTTPGSSISFSVTASGSPALFYQWRFNGSALSGQTNATLMLANVQAPQAGAYTVTVSNAVAVVTSDTAILSFGEADSDGDGLPDSWELAHGLDFMDPLDALDDEDNDRFLNLSEFIAGTNPTNAQSYLKIDSIAVGRVAVLAFTAESNRAYTVQYADALGAPWQTLTVLPPGPVTSTETVVDATTSATRFYRLSTATQPQVPLSINSIGVTRAAALTFNAVSNRAYRVEYKDAVGPGSWTTLREVTSRSVTRAATVADPATVSRRIYRLVIPGP